MKCPKCGQEVQGKFCSFCGAPLPQKDSPEYRQDMPPQKEMKREPPPFIPVRGQTSVQQVDAARRISEGGQWNTNDKTPSIQGQPGIPSPLWQQPPLPREKKKTGLIVVIIVASALVVVLGIILAVILFQDMGKPLEDSGPSVSSHASSSYAESEDGAALSEEFPIVDGTFAITAQELVDEINRMESLEYPAIGKLQKEVGEEEIRYTNTISQELQIIITCDPETEKVRSIGLQDSQYTEENYSWIYYAYLMLILDPSIDDQSYEELTDDLFDGAGSTYEVYYQRRGQLVYGCYYDDDILYLSITPEEGVPVEPSSISAARIPVEPNSIDAARTYGQEEPADIVVKGEVMGRLTINSAVVMSNRNQFSDKEPAQVFVLDYTYENIADTNDIYVCYSHFQIMDEQGNICDTYPLPVAVDKRPQEISLGASCNAREVFGTEEESESITIFYKYDMLDEGPTLIFEIPLSDEIPLF